MIRLPLTEHDRSVMLNRLGKNSFEALLEPIPDSVRLKRPLNLPEGLSEVELIRHMKALAAQNHHMISFLGAGSYEHFHPAVVDYLTARPEFRTAYTPYQPEVSQGTLQAIYEFQTAVVELMGMDVANASMYEGGSSTAESALMAQTVTRRSTILISGGLHPLVRQVVETYTRPKGISLADIPLKNGKTDTAAIRDFQEEPAAVLFQNPNFFGCIEDQHTLIEAAHDRGALAIASVDPLSLAVLQAPGDHGADIVASEGQPLAIPPFYGGPGVGLLACSSKLIRRIPGRLAGATVDEDGKRGFVLTLQAREQHIRRHRAASNICTNQALVALGFLITVSAFGPDGIRTMAEHCIRKAHYLSDRLEEIGLHRVHTSPFLWEFAIETPRPARVYVDELSERGYMPGLDLGRFDSERDHQLLIYVSELRTREEIDNLVSLLQEVNNGQ